MDFNSFEEYSKHFKNLTNKLFRMCIVTILFWICAYAIPDMEPSMLSESLLQDVFYGSRKTQKISYEEIKKKSENVTNSSSHHEEYHPYDYYNSYINQYEKEMKDVKKINTQNANRPNFEKEKLSILEEKNKFTKSLYSLYGNKTIFHMNLLDLERLVNTSVLSDGQAVIFWESLLQFKTDRAKLIFSKEEYEQDTEYYLFNILPLKAIGLSLLTILIFLITHNIQIYILKKDKTSFVFNLISITISLYITESLFLWKYFFSSSLMFIQFCLGIKYLIDSCLCHLGFNKEDLDIFISITKTKTLLQFTLKLIVFIIITGVIGVLSFNKFPFLLNYGLFYICLIQLTYLISFYLQYEAASIFQPLKHFVLVTIGVLNFFFTKFHKRMNRFPTYYTKADSFYLVSDIFSFICISFIYDYLFTQANNISHLFYDKSYNTTDLNNEIAAIVKNYKEQQKDFSIDDSLWILTFLLGLFGSGVGLLTSNYLTFYFSFHYFKLIFKVFGRLFKVRVIRVFYCYFIFIMLLFNHIMSTKLDIKFFEVTGINTGQIISFIRGVWKLIGIIYILAMIFINHEFIYYVNEKRADFDDLNDDSSDQVLRKIEITTGFERRKKKKYKTIEIHVIKEEKTNFSLLHIIYIHFDLYTNYCNICLLFYLIRDIEKNYIILIFYAFLIIIMMIRVYFVVNEFKNDAEYYYAYSISFFIGIRLLTISVSFTPLYTATCAYFLFLITLYCIIDRRRILITLLLVFHLLSACMYLHSNFLFIMIILIICLPLSFQNEDKKFNCTAISFIIPVLIVFFFQLYGFKNVLTNMVICNEYLKNSLAFDFFGFVQGIVHGDHFKGEFYFIHTIYDNTMQFFK